MLHLHPHVLYLSAHPTATTQEISCSADDIERIRTWSRLLGVARVVVLRDAEAFKASGARGPGTIHALGTGNGTGAAAACMP